MTSTLIRNARVVTAPAAGRRGPDAVATSLGLCDVRLEHGVIASVTTHDARRRFTSVEGFSVTNAQGERTELHDPPPAHADHTIDAAGRVLIPGFVDCHTHACWAGSRLDEWEQRLRGASYLDILRAGGGIMSTVRAVRAASRRDLADSTRDRLSRFLDAGTTTIEIKSGYGLTTADELKMLGAITDAAASWPGTVVPTALLGHAIDPDQPDFVRRTIRETLPAVHAEFPGIPIDLYLESGAWSLDHARALLEAALALQHPIRLHADQFSSMGGIPLAIALGARSVDHLEASTLPDLRALAASDVTGVILPVCGVHAEGSFADARTLLDAGGLLAIATNCNPGSAPTESMPLALAIAVRRCRVTPAEAIAAATSGAANVLRLPDRGRISPGLRADLCLLDTTDERDLAFRLASNLVRTVWCAGVAR